MNQINVSRPMMKANVGKARILFKHPEDLIFIANPYSALDHTVQYGNEEPRHRLEFVVHRSSPRLKDMRAALVQWEQEGRCRKGYFPPLHSMTDPEKRKRCEFIIPFLQAECKKKGNTLIEEDWVYLKIQPRVGRSFTLQDSTLKVVTPQEMQKVLVPGAKVNLCITFLVGGNLQPYMAFEGMQYLSPGINTKDAILTKPSPSPFEATGEGDDIPIDEVIAMQNAGIRLEDMKERRPEFRSPFQEQSAAYTEPVVVSLDDDDAPIPF